MASSGQSRWARQQQRERSGQLGCPRVAEAVEQAEAAAAARRLPERLGTPGCADRIQESPRRVLEGDRRAHHRGGGGSVDSGDQEDRDRAGRTEGPLGAPGPRSRAGAPRKIIFDSSKVPADETSRSTSVRTVWGETYRGWAAWLTQTCRRWRPPTAALHSSRLASDSSAGGCRLPSLVRGVWLSGGKVYRAEQERDVREPHVAFPWPWVAV